MHSLEISVLSPAIDSTIVGGSTTYLPTALEQTWGEFLPVESYFPNIVFLKSSNVGSPGLKRSGDNLPGRHGIVNTYSPVVETQKTFEFLTRSVTSEANARESVKEFVAWLYGLGEFRISFNGESQYRRMIYTQGSDYEMFEGVYGNDANFVLTLTCLDSLSYAKDYYVISNASFRGVAGTEPRTYNRYKIISSENSTGTTLNDPETIDYTPAILQFNFNTAPSQPGAYECVFAVSDDGINYYYIGIRVNSLQMILPYSLILNGETNEIYGTRQGQKYNGISWIRNIDSITPSISGNTIAFSMPFIMSKRTYILYSDYVPIGVNPGGTTRANLTLRYRPRVLAYD